MIKLYHRKNEIAIDLSEVLNVAAIDIYYTGKMYGESQLPDDWSFVANKKRIMCFTLGSSVPELLFNYTGLINIRGVNVIDKDLKSHSVAILVEDIDNWENMRGIFNLEGQSWESLGNAHKMEQDLHSTSLVKNNLHTKSEEYFFADGSPYEGEYHQHQDSQAMTGGEHTDESVLIYRKDAKGSIYNPRRKLKKSQILQIFKDANLKKSLPTTRGASTRAVKIGGDPAAGEGTSYGGGGSD